MISIIFTDLKGNCWKVYLPYSPKGVKLNEILENIKQQFMKK